MGTQVMGKRSMRKITAAQITVKYRTRMILTVRRFNGGYSFLEGGKIKDGFPLLEGREIFVDDILVNVAHHKDEKKKRKWFPFSLSV